MNARILDTQGRGANVNRKMPRDWGHRAGVVPNLHLLQRSNGFTFRSGEHMTSVRLNPLAQTCRTPT